VLAFDPVVPIPSTKKRWKARKRTITGIRDTSDAAIIRA
jgi:hypothetical protein